MITQRAREVAGNRMFDELVALLRDRKIEPGDRLLAERELATRYGISRPVVREALQRLESFGLVKKLPGQGSFISGEALKPEVITQYFALLVALRRIQLREIMSVRVALEVEAARLACENASELDRVGLEQSAQRIEIALNDPSLTQYLKAEYGFHDLLMRSSGNQFLRLLYDSLRPLLRQSYADTSQIVRASPEGSQQLIITHHAIAKAIRDRDSAQAVHAMLEHFEIAEHYYGEGLAQKEVEPGTITASDVIDDALDEDAANAGNKTTLGAAQ